jgi:hypothetical protein
MAECRQSNQRGKEKVKTTSVRYHGRKVKSGVVPVRQHLRRIEGDWRIDPMPKKFDVLLANAFLEKLARRYNLTEQETADFKTYVASRFPSNVMGEAKYMDSKYWDTGYIGEWAGRFQRGVEYDRSDLSGMRLLRKVNPVKYGERLYPA